jgi:hypothetical protein
MDSWSTDWSRPSEHSGPSFSGTLGFAADAPQPLPQGRISERVPIEMGAGLRRRGASGVSVQIMDLSTHGFRAATHLDLAVGTDVWLRLPGLEASHAKVAWQKGYMVGCAFERPLHPAVLDMIVRKTQGR